MKNLQRNLAAVLIAIACSTMLLASTTYADEIGRSESYIGRKIYIDSEEFRDMSSPAAGYQGNLIYDDDYLPWQPERPRRELGLEIFRNEKLAGSVVVLLTEIHLDQHGHPDWILVLDEKKFPKGVQFIGGYRDQDRCIAKEYPTDHVFVVGKWVNRKTKNGDYAGGYAHPIKKAWRVDFTAKKLVEIPPHGIKCEDNTQPGEID